MSQLVYRLARNVRYAGKVAKRELAVTLICALTVAVLAGLTTVTFAVFDVAVLRPLPFPRASRMAGIVNRNGESRRLKLASVEQWRQLRERTDCFDRIVAMRSSAVLLRTTREARQVAAREVSSDYFDVFGVPPMLGRVFLPGDSGVNAPPVVLSLHLWLDVFRGEKSAIGSTVLLNHSPHTIIGIMPGEFRDARDALLNPNLNAVWVLSPLVLAAPAAANRDLNIIARLKEGVSFPSAALQVTLTGQSTANTGDALSLAGMKDVWLNRQDRDTASFFIMAAALMITACCSISTIACFRWSRHWKDLAILSAFGAPRADLLGLFLIEGSLMGLPGGILGILLAWPGIKLIRSSGSLPFVRLQELSLDYRVIAFAAGISVLCSILIAISPALLILGSRLNIFSRRPPQTDRPPLLAVWTGFHTAATVGLLVAAGIAFRVPHTLNAVPLGFDASGVATFNIDAPAPGMQQAGAAPIPGLAPGLRRLPRIEAVAFASSAPFGLARFFTIKVQNSPGPLGLPKVEGRFASEGYFDALRIPVLEGRVFTADESASAAPVAVVSRSLAERYLAGRPAGRRIRLNIDPEGMWRQVIGVVGDVRDVAAADPPQPEVYLPFAASLGAPAVVVRTTLTTAELREAVRNELAALDRNSVAWGVRRLQDRSAEPGRFASLVGALLGMLALMSILLMSLGLYSASAWRGRRETIVRVALGAGSLRLMRTMLSQNAVALGAGMVSGSILANLGGAWVAGLLHGREGAASFTWTPVFALVIAAALLSAYRAARPRVHLKDQHILWSE